METKQAASEFECGLLCVQHESCASINYKTSGIGKGRCDLNNKTHQDITDDDETSNSEFNHLVIIKPRSKEPGQVYSPILRESEIVSSCKDLLLKKPSTPNGAYTLQLNTSSTPYEAYCHMTDIPGCGHGGWTLVLKVDGNKPTFHYDASLWTNNESYAVEDGLEGLTEKESKLASYWNTPFKKICLGMTVNGDRRWMILNYEASSLYSLIADGQYRNTRAKKNTWMSLIAGSVLQQNCNIQGFNVHDVPGEDAYTIHARLGFIANNEGHCDSPDSWIGFGVKYAACETVDFACGNRAVCVVEAVKNIPAFGYILLQ
ncbi:uncharacterized skeletal organic matrix protein 5-like [Dendronephthya gigantea]|uniref:uncharacterized skeletal organic matrix protein 5-like n=1 Tax=Dendronephthya gigantea TaxID=151771 RepID=UPI00106ABB1A|nr:uncharacterized skeletal organic matrix protein 5-like [Dendronephthya gigantea]